MGVKDLSIHYNQCSASPQDLLTWTALNESVLCPPYQTQTMAHLAQRTIGSVVGAARGATKVSVRPAFARQQPRLVAARVAVVDVNDDTFGDLVLKSSVPVLVDFW